MRTGYLPAMTFMPPHIRAHTAPLTMLQSLRAARRNVLEIIPAIAYLQPVLSGRMGSRWHMVQDPVALRRIFLDNIENYPKAGVMLRMLRPAVGDSLFTSEGEAWRWQRRAVAPVFAQRNVAALAPLMTATAERAEIRLAQVAVDEAAPGREDGDRNQDQRHHREAEQHFPPDLHFASFVTYWSSFAMSSSLTCSSSFSLSTSTSSTSSSREGQ